jgi:hypothetical protein
MIEYFIHCICILIFIILLIPFVIIEACYHGIIKIYYYILYKNINITRCNIEIIHNNDIITDNIDYRIEITEYSNDDE